jgi:hypothetical protein
MEIRHVEWVMESRHVEGVILYSNALLSIGSVRCWILLVILNVCAAQFCLE